jgi:hypothetical protein
LDVVGIKKEFADIEEEVDIVGLEEELGIDLETSARSPEGKTHGNTNKEEVELFEIELGEKDDEIVYDILKKWTMM